MTKRFQAPRHTTEVFTSTGPKPVVDGIIELPDDAPASDEIELRRAECIEIGPANRPARRARSRTARKSAAKASGQPKAPVAPDKAAEPSADEPSSGDAQA